MEQRLREMEAVLATGGISSSKGIRSIPSVEDTPEKTITITTPAVSQALILDEGTITQLFLPPPYSDNSAKAGSKTMSKVGRWD